MPDLPSGTVTLLFTDIEGSTRQQQQLGDAAYEALLAAHHRLLRDALAAHGGHEVDTAGDGFFAVFQSATEAVAAAATAQRALAAHPWPSGVAVRVRMGLHIGQPRVAGERYVGLDVHRAARIEAAAHGGQVLLSQVTASLVRDALPANVSLHSLGEYPLKDLERPEALVQLVFADLRSEFPPPRTLAADPPTATATRTSGIYGRVFVGREAELRQLQAAYDATVAGQGGLAMVVGEPGAGKTALCEQLAAYVASQGGRTVEGHCYEAGSLSLPYLPFVEALRSYVLTREATSLRRELGSSGPYIARLVPELLDRLDGPAVDSRSSAVGDQVAAGSETHSGPDTRYPTPDTRAEALEHLEFAIAEFQAMKMQPALERARQLRRRLGD